MIQRIFHPMKLEDEKKDISDKAQDARAWTVTKVEAVINETRAPYIHHQKAANRGMKRQVSECRIHIKNSCLSPQ